jgi:cytochrome c556
MIRAFIAVAALGISIQAAVPQNLDVIKVRMQTMKETGAAAGTVAKMLKGETPFNLARARASLQTIIDASAKMPALFPDNSKSGGDTKALAELWDNKPDVIARYAKLGQDATGALAAIKDQASLGASMPAVFMNCGGCHEKYRVSGT